MRDRVKINLGAGEHALLPAFDVVDAFEDRYYSLLEHLQKLMEGQAIIHARSYLILLGLQSGNPDVKWDQVTVMERMFERGYWDQSLVFIEQEFIERLLYTPEQYLAKKQERADQEAKMKAEMDGMFSEFSG